MENSLAKPRRSARHIRGSLSSAVTVGGETAQQWISAKHKNSASALGNIPNEPKLACKSASLKTLMSTRSASRSKVLHALRCASGDPEISDILKCPKTLQSTNMTKHNNKSVQNTAPQFHSKNHKAVRTLPKAASSILDAISVPNCDSNAIAKYSSMHHGCQTQDIVRSVKHQQGALVGRRRATKKTVSKVSRTGHSSAKQVKAQHSIASNVISPRRTRAQKASLVALPSISKVEVSSSGARKGAPKTSTTSATEPSSLIAKNVVHSVSTKISMHTRAPLKVVSPVSPVTSKITKDAGRLNEVKCMPGTMSTSSSRQPTTISITEIGVVRTRAQQAVRNSANVEIDLARKRVKPNELPIGTIVSESVNSVDKMVQNVASSTNAPVGVLSSTPHEEAELVSSIPLTNDPIVPGKTEQAISLTSASGKHSTQRTLTPTITEISPAPTASTSQHTSYVPRMKISLLRSPFSKQQATSSTSVRQVGQNLRSALVAAHNSRRAVILQSFRNQDHKASAQIQSPSGAGPSSTVSRSQDSNVSVASIPIIKLASRCTNATLSCAVPTKESTASSSAQRSNPHQSGAQKVQEVVAVTANQSGESKDCCICLDQEREILLSNRHFVSLRCGHLLCNTCYVQLTERFTRCPVCRTRLCDGDDEDVNDFSDFSTEDDTSSDDSSDSFDSVLQLCSLLSVRILSVL